MVDLPPQRQACRVSSAGRITLPKELREACSLSTPGEVFVYGEDGRIVIEPVPTCEDLHGIYAADAPPGSVIDAVRNHRDAEQAKEDQRESEFRQRLE